MHFAKCSSWIHNDASASHLNRPISLPEDSHISISLIMNQTAKIIPFSISYLVSIIITGQTLWTICYWFS